MTTVNDGIIVGIILGCVMYIPQSIIHPFNQRLVEERRSMAVHVRMQPQRHTHHTGDGAARPD